MAAASVAVEGGREGGGRGGWFFERRKEGEEGGTASVWQSALSPRRYPSFFLFFLFPSFFFHLYRKN